MRLLMCIALICALLASSSAARAQAAARDGAIITSVAYHLPAYDSLAADERRELDNAATRAAYDSARADTRFVIRRVRYASDGLQVVAYVYEPRVAAKRPAAAIITRAARTSPATGRPRSHQ